MGTEYAPLFPLLADYWDKPLSKLPKALRARVGSEDFAIGVGFGWGELTPEQRRERAEGIDRNNDPKFREECQYYSDLLDEIRKWELMEHQNDPIKAKIQDEKLGELRTKLALTPPTVKVATQKRQRQDALAVELDEILVSMKTRTPAKVMAKLREQIGKPYTCILRNVGDGIEWENNRGDVRPLTIALLGERIREWKKTGLSQG